MKFENRVTMYQQLPEELVDQPQEDVIRPPVGTRDTQQWMDILFHTIGEAQTCFSDGKGIWKSSVEDVVLFLLENSFNLWYLIYFYCTSYILNTNK